MQPEPDRAIGLTEFEAWGRASRPYRFAPAPAGNLAAETHGSEFPKSLASHSDRFGGTPEKAIDGRTNFLPSPVNRWTSYESPSDRDWLEIQFGKPVTFDRIDLAIYDDRGGVQPPKRYWIEHWADGEWLPVAQETHVPDAPQGSTWNVATFPPCTSDRVRIWFEHRLPAKSGVTEVMVWQPGSHPQ
jgi:hypothetical protein